MNLSSITTQAARQHGARIAVIDGERSWTYATFDRLVDGLASGLAERFAPGERIGVMMSNRAEAVMLQFALERASLVRVPVNSRYTAHELTKLMADCRASAVMYDDACAEAALAAQLDADVALIHADERSDQWRALVTHVIVPEVLHRADAETLATINYTSGTTGTPKGVMLSHGNWMAVYRNMLVDRDLRETDVVAYVGPLTHSSGAYLAPWFWRGAQNIIVDPPTAPRLLDVIESRRITAFTCVPTFLTKLLSLPGIEMRQIGSLRLIGYGAEPIPANTIEKAWRVFGPILWQNYGQTEAMMTCAHLPPQKHLGVDASGKGVLRHGLIGQPYTFVEMMVRDATGQAAPTGTIGELTLRGDHVMQGYWNRPEATAQVLRDGWLWTGDLAIQDEQGMFRLVGRQKEMLICGGFNIYPGEIEAQLTALSGVLEAAVIARPDDQWGEIAVAFVAVTSDCHWDADALTRTLRPVLGIKTPKAWHIVAELPKTNNGKINKKALADRDRTLVQEASI